MPISKRQLAAFTLVELLVVIAVIGILIALLLPAVQQAREASRRSQCSNNLKQIGLAYQCYLSAYHVFPPSSIQALPPTYDITTYPPVGWGIYILPYLELKNLFDQYNFKKPFWDGYPANTGNQVIATTQIECFRCPSAPLRDPYTYTYSDPPMAWRAAAADYSPVARVAPSLASLLWPAQTFNDGDSKLAGVLQANKSTPPDVISDGTSHTILVAEIAGKNFLWQRGKNMGQILSGNYGGQGGWADATSASSVFVGSSEDGSVAPGTSGINASNDYGLYAFHRVLANVAMADGSVQSLATEIDIKVLVGLLTRAGGEMEGNP